MRCYVQIALYVARSVPEPCSFWIMTSNISGLHEGNGRRKWEDPSSDLIPHDHGCWRANYNRRIADYSHRGAFPA